jgi:uncharacterized protein involved in oxidation of intracellular sulfur
MGKGGLMQVLILINDAPYGTEKAYNALRLAMTLQNEHAETQVRIFLMADAVMCALPNQVTPAGHYSLEHMFKSVISQGAQVKASASCAEARGIKGLPLIDGVGISTMSQLSQWIIESDRVATF